MVILTSFLAASLFLGAGKRESVIPVFLCDANSRNQQNCPGFRSSDWTPEKVNMESWKWAESNLLSGYLTLRLRNWYSWSFQSLSIWSSSKQWSFGVCWGWIKKAQKPETNPSCTFPSVSNLWREINMKAIFSYTFKFISCWFVRGETTT